MPASQVGARRLGVERGSALVVVLWISALLAAMAMGFSTSMRTESLAGLNLVENVRVRALADAAVQRGIRDLVNATEDNSPLIDGTAVKFDYGGGALSVAIRDEHGKTDLNKVTDEFLKSILHGSGMGDAAADALVDAIADWRDEDDFRRINGAEAPAYKSAGLKFEPTNAPFQSVAELQQVIGVGHRTYQRLAPLFTVYSSSGKINPNFAPREILTAIPGVSLTEVEALLAARENLSTDENVILPALSEVGAWISKSSGPVYTVRGTASLPSGAVFTREVVVWIPESGENPYWILDMRPGSAPEPEAPKTDP